MLYTVVWCVWYSAKLTDLATSQRQLEADIAVLNASLVRAEEAAASYGPARRGIADDTGWSATVVLRMKLVDKYTELTEMASQSLASAKTYDRCQVGSRLSVGCRTSLPSRSALHVAPQ